MSTTLAPIADFIPLIERPQEISALKRKHALRNHGDNPSDAGTATEYLVEGLLPQRQLGILVGNSGLGKSPLLYQLGICISAGIPFLGEQTVQADVLYFDFENGGADSRLLEERIAKFQGLPAVPDGFLRWNADDCAPQFGRLGHGIEDIIRDWSQTTAGNGRPKLAIVDPLRFWLKTVEDARHADTEIQRARRVISETRTAILGVHHLRRVTSEASQVIPCLEADPRSWIQAMSRGATALINGSDVRMGLEKASSPFASNRAAIVLAGFRRVHGQLGPLYIERVHSEETSEPLGYRRLASVELLGNEDHARAFAAFPARFTFTDARRSFGKSDSATDNLLKKCESLKLLQKDGRHYVKTAV